MKKKIQKMYSAASVVLVAALTVLALLLVGVRLIGLQVFTVLSGSMEPTYQTGSLIYVKKVDYRQLQDGDVITFRLNEDTVATHRIVELVPDGADPDLVHYRTKGDANSAADQTLVHCKDVLGTPVFTIPKLGYLVNTIQHPPGNYLIMASGLLVLLPACIPDKTGSDSSDEEENIQSEINKKRKRKKGGKYLRK